MSTGFKLKTETSHSQFVFINCPFRSISIILKNRTYAALAAKITSNRCTRTCIKWPCWNCNFVSIDRMHQRILNGYRCGTRHPYLLFLFIIITTRHRHRHSSSYIFLSILSLLWRGMNEWMNVAKYNKYGHCPVYRIVVTTVGNKISSTERLRKYDHLFTERYR